MVLEGTMAGYCTLAIQYLKAQVGKLGALKGESLSVHYVPVKDVELVVGHGILRRKYS